MLNKYLSCLKSGEGMSFTVKVKPNAKETCLNERMEDGSWKISVAAPARAGKANAELIKFLAKEFEVSKSSVEIVSGKTSRNKRIKIVVTNHSASPSQQHSFESDLQQSSAPLHREPE